jgi:hypothetical protein
MRKTKTEGLTFPADPLAAMRELQDLDASPPAVSATADDQISPAVEPRQYDKSYSNMTSHMTDLPDSKTEGPPYDKLPDQAISQQTRKMTGPSVDQSVGQTAGQPSDPSSIRQAILATVQQGGQMGETLKTVTIKLAPTLDRRVEEHCFITGRKKQEVVRDALLLYFELLEQEG